ncbi:7-carboxy-7-deazaguanine synthase QueE [bacterium]|jgi:7-carboxy-7-deazaguanine synthase|nr:7-carboxy-7-deazaguanine synthase QueE [Hellea sp.]MDA7807099.1 7-carboxy-7-deazaguanine synthase QueE [bacterium]MDA9047732.1 7-carboxy-7-deazaguanine synthase QueE [Hellea sp.]MDA9225382.1 7-carboxy-7-deazaguanine synthase QueE [bacterium]
MTLRYSETFYSAQGEGSYVGIPSLWMRFFLCNLQCNGFGQKDPTEPSTYELPYETIDITNIDNVFDLPVFDKGCDSSYTWSKRYKHLITDKTVEEAVDELQALLPHGNFIHPVTQNKTHMVFTGGEPMIKKTQPGMISVLEEFAKRKMNNTHVTVETNGTRAITPELEEFLENRFYATDEYGGMIPDSLGTPEWYWSVSPKLWSTAGEKHSKAICPEIVGKYAEVSNHGQLKFVVNGSEESWREVEDNTKLFREAGCNFPVWIMGVGGTFEGLVQTEATIADEAIQRGYNYTSRVHVHIYGNAIGK